MMNYQRSGRKINCSTVRCSHCKQIREGGNCLPLVIMNSIKPLELVECWITRILH